MKRLSFFVLLALTFLSIYSCDISESTLSIEDSLADGDYTVLHVSLPADTKLGHDYAEGVLKVSWSPGDQIAVTYSDAGTFKSIVFTQTGSITNNGKTTDFTADATIPSGTAIYAYYPASSVSAEQHIVDISSQEGTLSSLSEADIMMATGEYSEGMDFEFKHQSAFLHIQNLVLEGNPTSPVQSISVMGNAVGNQIAWSNGSPSINAGSVVATGPIPVESGKITDAFLSFIPKQAQEGDNYKVVVTLEDGKQFSMNWFAAKAYEASKMYRLAPAEAVSQRSSSRKNFPVVLVEFSDLKFSVADPVAAFDKLFNATGMPNNQDPGSVSGYYRDQSDGAENLHFDIYGVIPLNESYAYYGADNGSTDTNIKQIVYDILPQTTFDFSQYDNTGDGNVDDLIIIFAGLSQEYGAGTDHIWSYSRNMEMDKYNPECADIIYRNGKYVFNYLLSSELCSASQMAGPGVICHELGHRIYDLPDLYYRTDKNEGKEDNEKDMTYLALMASGDNNMLGHIPSNMSSVEREYAGFLTPTIITSNGTYVIRSIEGNKAYRINTATDGEYFLIEYRNNKGWDSGWPDSNFKGMVVYHVDRSDNIVGGSDTAASLWTAHIPNCYQDHYCAYPLSASPEDEGWSYAYRAGRFFPGVYNNTSLTLTAWDGTTVATISGIQESNASATFTVAIN